MTRRLVQKRQLAGQLQHALDHEHHVRPAGVVFIEHERHVVLQRPGQNAVLELGDLLALLQHDRILADEIDARDVAVEVDAHAGPIEPRRDLLDMGRFAGAVIARDHDAAVLGEAGEDRERRLPVEDVVGIQIGHMVLGRGVGRDIKVRIDAEHLPGGHLHVRQAGRGLGSGEHGCLFDAGPRSCRPPAVRRPEPPLSFTARLSRAQFPRHHNAAARRTVLDRARAGGARRCGSAQAGGLERVVRLDDVAQPLLEGAVAAVRVRVEPLHQGLVLRLDGRGVGGFVEAQNVERPAAPERRSGAASARATGGGSRRGPRRAGCRADRRRPNRARPRRLATAWPPLTPMDHVGRWPITASF